MASKGQLSKFRAEYCQRIVDFFRVAEAYREHEDEKGKVQLIPTDFRTFEGFAARELKVDEDTVIEWTKHPENKGELDGIKVSFSVAYARAKRLQKDLLLRGAHVGAYNPQFSIFFAKNNLGMKDEATVHTPEVVEAAKIHRDIAAMTPEERAEELQRKLSGIRKK